jgi:putative phosphoesterase
MMDLSSTRNALSEPQQTTPHWTTIGIVADTHIPDRVNTLHPEILPIMRAANVQRILHAGDISIKPVLTDLSLAAPVTAVRGNRDFLARNLKMVETVNINGVCIALMHGHGGLLNYLRDKVHFYRVGYRLTRYLKLLATTEKSAQVVIFGHTHHPEIAQYDGKLIFNPGSACFGYKLSDLPSIGLLHISPSGEVRPEIVLLPGWKIQGRKWIKI